MIELSAQEWFTLTGRGRVAVVDATQLDGALLSIGDRVRIDGVLYVVEDLGGMRVVNDLRPLIGIRVRESTDPQDI
ncbi:MAG: hypothetical protein ABWY93_30730 [Mycobacterium sp.]